MISAWTCPSDLRAPLVPLSHNVDDGNHPADGDEHHPDDHPAGDEESPLLPASSDAALDRSHAGTDAGKAAPKALAGLRNRAKSVFMKLQQAVTPKSRRKAVSKEERAPLSL